MIVSNNIDGKNKIDFSCDNCEKIFSQNYSRQVKRRNSFGEGKDLCRSCAVSKSRKGKPLTDLQKTNNPTYKIYWTSRGYTDEQSREEIRKIKGLSKESWIEKGFSEEESIEKAKQKSRSRNKGTIEYWKKHHPEKSEKEIETEIEKYKDSFIQNIHKVPFNVLTEEYWISKGHSTEEAKNLVLKNQRERLDKRDRKKMGESISRYYSDPRNSDKIKIAGNKISEKLKKHERKHSPIFKEYWIEKGFSERDSVVKAREVRINGDGGNSRNTVSKIENKFFRELSENFPEFTIIRNKHITCNKNFYCPDGKINSLIIEFFGTRFHLDERKYNKDTNHPYGKKSHNDVKENDQLKIKDYLSSGYSVFIVWELDYKKDKQKIFEKIHNILKTHDFSNSMFWETNKL